MGLPVKDNDIPPEEPDRMAERATEASNFLKAISHEGRLMILCHLATGEKSVTDLENLLSARQAAVSQQLSRLRLEGLVTPRREGKTIGYANAAALIGLGGGVWASRPGSAGSPPSAPSRTCYWDMTTPGCGCGPLPSA